MGLPTCSLRRTRQKVDCCEPASALYNGIALSTGAHVRCHHPTGSTGSTWRSTSPDLSARPGCSCGGDCVDDANALRAGGAGGILRFAVKTSSTPQAGGHGVQEGADILDRFAGVST
jgi:hypothetical protein